MLPFQLLKLGLLFFFLPAFWHTFDGVLEGFDLCEAFSEHALIRAAGGALISLTYDVERSMESRARLLMFTNACTEGFRGVEDSIAAVTLVDLGLPRLNLPFP